MRIKGDDARRFMLAHHRLTRVSPKKGHGGIRDLLKTQRCIQLDPLEPMGSNADLVALARVDGIQRGDVYDAILSGHGFEHFCKERCLLPGDAFPWYARRAPSVPWWRIQTRLKRVDPRILDAVLDEVRQRGPITARELTDHGAVKPLDWSGWMGTSKATSMALEILWTRCQVVVSGRKNGAKIYDIPERALQSHLREMDEHDDPSFWRWALLDRVQAAGLLTLALGPQWGLIAGAKKAGIPDALVKEGQLERVVVEGSSRQYLAPKDILDRIPKRQNYDDRMRLLGPLDALIWDRKLVQQIFDFEYIWEVYKPKPKRRWGWYVCPLLYRGQLVGRVEGKVVDDHLRIIGLWKEKKTFDDKAFHALMERHALALNLKGHKLALQ